MTNILLVDDDPSILKLASRYLERSGFTTTSCATLAEGKQAGHVDDYDIVLLDVDMPDGNGLDLIHSFRALPSEPEVIILTGNGVVDGVARAIREGAWSYIEKQNFIKEIDLNLTQALQFRGEKQKIKTIPVSLQRKNIIGTSDALQKCLDQVALAAPADAGVLITGETGTGKELFAQAVHSNSERAGGNFVVVDCAALPENLFESLLFGHIRGAFTGADSTRDGLIRAADGGTLFLDEVGELPMEIQKKFLRVVQERSYRRIGEDTEQQSNFRLVAATNRDLDQMTRDGTFRKDLLFRLRTFTIELPPLRERMEDIRQLSRAFVGQLCDRFSMDGKGISPDFFDCLAGYNWPGNVRELKQVIEQAFAGARSFPTLYGYHLPEQLRILHTQNGLSSQVPPEQNGEPFSVRTWPEYKKQCEQHYLNALIKTTAGDIKASCRLSTLSRARLYELLKKHQIRVS
ncbi:MAG: sigma-54 dependent transcriptional regulator [Desulfobulbaceae bacterium]|nr:sigma-54 dependent transcriptional regulator [Desulfobulbaceae bacterium]